MLDFLRRKAFRFLRLARGLRLVPVALFFVAAAAIAAEPTEPTWQNGAQVYAKVCHYCHDAGVGPVLLGRQLPPEYVQLMVRRGLRAMPAFSAAFIDDAALADVGRYIQQSAPPSRPASPAPSRAPVPSATLPGRAAP